jgi:hypothetical protein
LNPSNRSAQSDRFHISSTRWERMCAYFIC